MNIFPHAQYCRTYGRTHDDVAPFVVNQHKNGLLTPWGYNATHGVPQLTVEDYVTSRSILRPLRIWDGDRPVHASAAYLFTTVERARDLQQRPVDILNHIQHEARQRSTQAPLDEIEAETDRPSGAAGSSVAAACRTRRSADQRPTNGLATGRPTLVTPHRTLAAGCPVGWKRTVPCTRANIAGVGFPSSVPGPCQGDRLTTMRPPALYDRRRLMPAKSTALMVAY
ncbi:MAG: hypothetical protein ACRERE_39595 [Candidatus Entotheonellia bacterium]